MSLGAVEITFEIDPTKVEVVTRAARLRPIAIGYLTSLRDAAAGHGDPHGDVGNLDEAIAWLNEMVT